MSDSTNEADQEALVPMEIQFRSDQFDDIEARATRAGVDRSAIVRRMYDLGRAEYERAETNDENENG